MLGNSFRRILHTVLPYQVMNIRTINILAEIKQYFSLIAKGLQWNLSKTDSIGELISVLYIEVSLF